jgi:glycosyltransferase involved in cell wall biosynthesis
MSRIVIVTTGQLSTNPRMLKEVDAIQKQGHEVKVLYSYWTDWAAKADEDLLKDHPDIFQQIGGDPLKDKLTYFFSRLLHKFARQAGRYIPGLQYYSIARNAYFLERAACREKADLYIGHNLGSLPAVVKAAKKWKAKCGFDAEDYHRGQFEEPSGPAYKYTVATEEKFMPACDYLTAASPLIAAAYKHILPARDIVVINNVFSKKWIQPLPEVNTGPLRLFWFSQTVGRDRGLELIINAINLLPGVAVTLDLMGDCPESFRKYLENIAAKSTALHFLPPVPADELFAVAAAYDIGMAAEIPHSENRDICLTNKLFTYLLAGNCILASDTKAQRLFMENNSGIGFLYRNDSPDDLAARLKDLYKDRAGLRQCRRRSLALASEKYNWESESAIFLNLIASVLEEK